MRFLRRRRRHGSLGNGANTGARYPSSTRLLIGRPRQQHEYIARHKKEGRLNYAAAKKQHLPIGTGVTEAAAKTLVTVRMKRSGARYETHGGHTILTLRAAALSQRFDAFSSEVESMYSARVAA